MGILAAVVVVNVKMADEWRAALQPDICRNMGIDIHVPYVQAEPQPRVVHPPDDIQQHLRFFLHDVFQRDGEAGGFCQK